MVTGAVTQLYGRDGPHGWLCWLLRSSAARSLRSRCRTSLEVRHGEPARLELSRELNDNLPLTSLCGFHESEREGMIHAVDVGRFVWPKRDRLTRTYVNPRRVVGTRVAAGAEVRRFSPIPARSRRRGSSPYVSTAPRRRRRPRLVSTKTYALLGRALDPQVCRRGRCYVGARCPGAHRPTRPTSWPTCWGMRRCSWPGGTLTWASATSATRWPAFRLLPPLSSRSPR
jgi:hypothetical protein